ncbi:subclass B3 metallo-beta-lactamase [Sphingomonas sp. ASV193]|uniref:subclass B3 metallo-beta-lactamase n=1 Tax=Sphingomonas sp. ASV193 TaxID=3144405 RepID=UPI0032E91449
MFANPLLSIALIAQQIVIPLGNPPKVENLPAPIEQYGPTWAAACKDAKDPDSWTQPAPPVRINGNAYLVGTCGISSIFIHGSAGDVLIDGGPEAAAPMIEANIRSLGYSPRNIRYILVSHEHSDHVGGIAAIQRASGAVVVASAAAARALGQGAVAADDPQAGGTPFPPVTVGRTVRDGEEVRLGNIMLTAITTPGHTLGATSWRWVSCDGGVCRTIVYADSLTPITNKRYRFSDHPAMVAAFRASIAKIAASECEILLTPHPAASDMPARLAAGKPLLDTGACKAYAAAKSAALDAKLAEERDGK